MTPGGRRSRFGVALLVPEPWRTEIDALRRAAGDGSLGRVPAHLTLVPPVNVHRRDVRAAVELVQSVAAETAPLVLDLGPPETFLPDNPVLHLPVHGRDADRLVALRDAVFRPPLERKPSWPFVPHVTLCDEGDPERVESAVLALGGYTVRIGFERIHLLVHEAGVWGSYADFAFRGQRVVGRGGLEVEIAESSHLADDTRRWLDEQWRQWDAEEFPAERWQQEPFALVARRERQIVGAATGWTNRTVGYVEELVVAAGTRREGIGSHLLAAVEDLARRRGAVRLALRTHVGTAAARFYEQRGWRVEVEFDDWVRTAPYVQLRKDLSEA